MEKPNEFVIDQLLKAPHSMSNMYTVIRYEDELIETGLSFLCNFAL